MELVFIGLMKTSLLRFFAEVGLHRAYEDQLASFFGQSWSSSLVENYFFHPKINKDAP
jgi:hypothetical protein